LAAVAGLLVVGVILFLGALVTRRRAAGPTPAGTLGGERAATKVR
jgi:hypothetical protein